MYYGEWYGELLKKSVFRLCSILSNGVCNVSNLDIADKFVLSFNAPVPSRAPGNITSTNTSSTSLLITWEHIPKKLVHGILLGYRVFYHQFVGEEEIGPRRRRRAIDYVNETIETLPPSATFLRIFNLIKFTNYSFRIVGFTSKGDGKISQTFNVSTDEDSKSMLEIFTAMAL